MRCACLFVLLNACSIIDTSQRITDEMRRCTENQMETRNPQYGSPQPAWLRDFKKTPGRVMFWFRQCF
jgi:hypothetical protein